MGAVSVTFNEEDRLHLQKINARMHNRPNVGLFNFLYSCGSALMCSPKEDLYERTVTILTSLNVMVGLIFSGIASNAMNPLDVMSFPEEKQVLASIYNLLAIATGSVNTCMIAFSTYLLFLICANSHTSDLGLRSVLYLSPMIGLMQYLTFATLFGVLAMMCIAAHFRMPSLMAWIATAAVICTFAATHLMFVETACKAFPWEMWNWAPVAGPWKIFSCLLRNEAQRIGSLQLAEAEKGVMAGLDANNDGKVDMAREMTVDELQLVAVVDRALPELSPKQNMPLSTQQVLQSRHDMLIGKLLAEKMTLPTLKKTAQQPGGFHVLIDMLSAEALGSHLMRGEVMALAAEIMEAATAAVSEIEGD